MVKIPVVYRTGSDVVTTAGVEDLASGINLVNIYAGRSLSLDPSEELGEYRFVKPNVLSSEPFYSHLISSDVINLYEASSRGGIRFDMDFEKTHIIDGNVLVQMEFGISSAGSGSCLLTLAHVDNAGVQTEIVSGSTRTIEYAGSGITLSGSSTKLLMPRTTFEIGEKFRLIVKSRLERAPVFCTIFHDPMNGGLTGAEHTDLILQVPFDFDV